jgi:predicted Rossmann fold flavoprotein
MHKPPVVIIAGGGAAGFFAAIHIARSLPESRVTILEKSSQVLGKVRISGGGRCNVTHACFDNRQLIRYYPRGGKALLGSFSRFSTTDTVNWFKNEGVLLKTEEDGRMFPVSDDSATIVECLMHAAENAGVKIQYGSGIQQIVKVDSGWQLILSDDSHVSCDALVMATGSSNQCWNMLAQLGVEIIKPVPSLFTFHIPEKKLHALSGLSIANVTMKLEGTKIQTDGPLLVTHFGFSGPATLKLSAWAARELAASDYKAAVLINFLPELKASAVNALLLDARMEHNRKLPRNTFLFEEIPRRLWEFLLQRSGISDNLNWADVPNRCLNKLTEELTNGKYSVDGKSTFKDEFVTCGGVELNEVDLRTMQSKKFPGLFFCGETVNVDAVTGGFNFQWAWTSGSISASGVEAMLNVY